jgi:hypothetical protein
MVTSSQFIIYNTTYFFIFILEIRAILFEKLRFEMVM